MDLASVFKRPSKICIFTVSYFFPSFSEVDTCTEEAENLQSSFVVHTEAMEAHRLSLQTVRNDLS